MLLRDVATVQVGPAPPEGATLRNGESVSGMVIMLKSENGKLLIERAKEKIASLRLPPGVKIVPFYDQSFVIDGTNHTVEKNLFEGFLLVSMVLLLFLGNIRAALITATIIPLSMVISFLGMRVFGISANLMSLGAIDFGMIVDSVVVMMENSVHRLEERHREETTLVGPARGAGNCAANGFRGDDQMEGHRPMAVTACMALAGSLILALKVHESVTIRYRIANFAPKP